MKGLNVFLATALLISSVSCSEGEKSAEDIEKEYASNGTTSDTDNQNGDVTNHSTTDQETTSNSEFEYIEDFTKLDSKTKLYETLDPIYLADGTDWYAEGTVEFQVTTYYDPNTLNEYRFIWDQDDNETLGFIEVYLNLFDEMSGTVRQQFVMSKTGIFTGMTLQELYDWNNKNEIRFSGFGWDFGGGIYQQEGTPIANSGLILRLGLENYIDETYNHLMGDMELSTSDEKVMEAPIRVDMISIYMIDVEM